MYLRPSLTSLLGDSRSETSQFFRAALPQTLPVRQAFRDTAGDSVVAGEGGRGGAAGSAFDVLAMATVRPEDFVPFQGPPAWTRMHYEFLDEICKVIESPERGDDYLRAVWAYGLLVSSIRSVQAFFASPINGPLFESETLDEVVAALPEIITPANLEDLARLQAVAEVELYTRLPSDARFHVSFSNEFVMAEADVVAGGLILDVKTSRGTAGRDSMLRLLPTVKDIYQVIAYALLARIAPDDDIGSIESVGIYAARYGAFITWSLPALLDQLAGGVGVGVDDLAVRLESALGMDAMLRG